MVTQVTKLEPEDVKEGPAQLKGVDVHGMCLDTCGWSKKDRKLLEAHTVKLCLHYTLLTQPS